MEISYWGRLEGAREKRARLRDALAAARAVEGVTRSTGQSALTCKMKQELHIPRKDSRGKKAGRDFKNTQKHSFRR